MKPLTDDSRAILRDLAADSDPAPATEEDAREARAAYERAIDEMDEADDAYEVWLKREERSYMGLDEF